MNNDDFHSLFSELQQLEGLKDYSNIADKLGRRFESKTNAIISKWKSSTTLSNEEKQYLDILSNLEIFLVKYCLSIYNTGENDQNIIGKLRACLFRKNQIDPLQEAVIFIRDNGQSNNEDEILIYIMRMLDARTLAYRLCFKDLHPPPRDLNKELYACLNHKEATNCLNEIIFPNETKKKISTNRHRFFLGCCTFAVALFEENLEALKDNTKYEKYIFRLAKYVRVVLSQQNFAKNELFIYCLRGILALLTNCIPTEYWLDIINNALANKNDDQAQRKNPFNTDLFLSIINKLLGSDILRQNAMKYDSNDEALLVDIALVFLHKWCYTPGNSNDDDGEDNLNKTNKSSSSTNQVVDFLRTNSSLDGNKDKTEIILPYIDAKYDRIRLMAFSTFSTLANVMSYEEFKILQKSKPTMGKDLVKLIFNFIQQADESSNRQCKGVPFQRLLRYLLQFLVQDFIKIETLPYVSKIVDYATKKELYALPILCKISSNPKLKQDLLGNTQLTTFLENDTKYLFDNDPRAKEIIKQIHQNLAPEEPSAPINNENRQIFISYSHDNKEDCNIIEEKLRIAEPSINIWLDKYYMGDNVTERIVNGISQSQVVLVLLSEPYVASDVCRREWTFAMNKNKQIFHVVLQKSFPRKKYDWVVFNLTDAYCYMIYKEGELERLIRDSSAYYNAPEKLHTRPNTENIQDKPATLARKVLRTSNGEYLRKRSITEWTSGDIQDWCIDNKLAKWCELFNDYDGDALIELQRILSVDSHLQHIANINKFNLIDVTLLKSKLDKLISTATITRKKNITKRRVSKTSTK